MPPMTVAHEAAKGGQLLRTVSGEGVHGTGDVVDKDRRGAAIGGPTLVLAAGFGLQC
jgi:hypothetical protein